MLRKLLIVSLTLSLAISFAAAADAPPTRSNLSAAEIVNRNVTARGGLQAWRAVQSMSMQGKMGAGGNQRTPIAAPVSDKRARKLPVDPRPAEEVQLPFVMEMQRPHKVRFELQFKGQTALQVFDGVNGWKLRPYLNRRDIEPFTADELKAASMKAELDGPLVDYTSKSTRAEFDSMEKVEDHDTYKLKLTMKDGQVIHVWIDTHTFLEAKIEGRPRRLDGINHPVEVYYRDYRLVDGLQIPFVLETRVLPASTAAARVKEILPPAEKIVMEKVVVNPRLDASLFVKPEIQTAAVSH